MQIFILGEDKVGKSTVARGLLSHFASNGHRFELYEAGSWARAEFALTEEGQSLTDEQDPRFREALSRYAHARLREDPFYSLMRYADWRHLSEKPNVLIAGVRNPEDLVHMLALEPDNQVVRLRSRQGGAAQATQSLFGEGLAVIDSYLSWKAKLGGALPQYPMFVDDLQNDAAMAQLAFQLQNNFRAL